MESYFKLINKQIRKYRNHFVHKEDLLSQDKLSERLYQIHTFTDGIEYVPFDDIIETKKLLSGFVDQFIWYIYIYILKNKMIFDFVPIE